MAYTTLWVIFFVLFFIALLISLYRYFHYRRGLNNPSQPHHVVATPVYAVYSNGAFVGTTTEGNQNHGEFSAVYQNHEGQPYPYPPQGPPPSYFHYENHTQVVAISEPHSSPPPPPYVQSQQAQPVVVGFNNNCNTEANTNNNNNNVNNLNNGQHQPHNQQLQPGVPKTVVTAPFTEIPLNN